MKIHREKANCPCEGAKIECLAIQFAPPLHTSYAYVSQELTCSSSCKAIVCTMRFGLVCVSYGVLSCRAPYADMRSSVLASKPPRQKDHSRQETSTHTSRDYLPLSCTGSGQQTRCWHANVAVWCCRLEVLDRNESRELLSAPAA